MSYNKIDFLIENDQFLKWDQFLLGEILEYPMQWEKLYFDWLGFKQVGSSV